MTSHLSRLLGWLLPERAREFVLGDLDELYGGWRARWGPMVATLRYVGLLITSAVALRLRRHGASPTRTLRPSPSGTLVDELRLDVGRAARSLRRQPGLVALVALTLGVGIGSVVGVFDLVSQFLLRPPPGIVDPAGAGFLSFESTERAGRGVSGPVAETLIREAGDVASIATYDYIGVLASVEGSRPVEARAYTVYGDYFGLLGVRPSEGRLLAPEETGPDADPTRAVISEGLRRRLFGEAGDVVGRRFRSTTNI